MLICLYWQPALPPGCRFDQVAPSPHPASPRCLPSLVHAPSGSARCLKGPACLWWQRGASTLARLGASTLPPGNASILMGTSALVGLGTSVFSRITVSTQVRMGTSVLICIYVFISEALRTTVLLRGGVAPGLGWAHSCWNPWQIHIGRNNK